MTSQVGRTRAILVLVAILLATPVPAPAQLAPSPTGFKIVVIAGEDAVNIIQQKTAVAPIVEVRDENDLPVAGILVTFSVRGGSGATFGGLQTLTATTNAAGQAVATGLTPTATGAIQINAAATVQGQAVTATITQTNFATAAQAAQASSGAASGSGAGASGLSGRMMGILGGAAGAVGLVAATAGGSGSDSTSTTPAAGTSSAPSATTPPIVSNPTPATPASATYTGTFTGSFAYVLTADGSCTFTFAVRGTLRMDLETRTDGSVGGTAAGSYTTTLLAAACPFPPIVPEDDEPRSFAGPISGSPSSLRFSHETTESGGGVTAQSGVAFSGSLTAGVISGTLTITANDVFVGPGGTGRGTGSGTFPVTLR